MDCQRHFLTLPAVLLRVAGLSIDVLDGQRATAVTYRLGRYSLRKQAWESGKEQLLTDLFAVVKTMDVGKHQQRLQQLRRDLHNGRIVHGYDLESVLSWLPDALANRLQKYVQEKASMERYLVTTSHLYRQQALLARRSFQLAIGDASFGQGLALSSLSLLRQRAVYQRKDPTQFRKDDYQLENGLVRYFTRAATKTTPYSTFTHMSIASGCADFAADDLETRSHVQLSVRMLGLLHELIRANRRLREYEPVSLNPSLTVADGHLHYVRQYGGQVACARLPINSALRWMIANRTPVITYSNWVSGVRTRFQATGMQAHQYIDKLLELGLLQRDMPVSATDSAWPVALRDWLVKHRWLTPSFTDNMIQLLDALLFSARTILTATAQQRATLLQKAHLLLTEWVSNLSESPSADFWPLRAEQLFFEDVIRPLNPASQQVDTTTLIKLTQQLTSHVSESCKPPVHSLANLFKQVYQSAQTVPFVSFFEQYLNQPIAPKQAVGVPECQRVLWESWAEQGIQGQTINLRSTWIPDALTHSRSEGVFWQTWINSRGEVCAALNNEAGSFGRMYGRFLPYFNPAFTHSMRHLNRKAAGDTWLVEPTDDHYHNANIHPTLLDGTILTPGGHQPQGTAGPKICINELVVRLSPDGSEVELWHPPTHRRIIAADMGFQSSRSTLYAFLCQFTPIKQSGVGLFCSVINHWYATKRPSPTDTVWPRIILDNQLIIQRQTWQLRVGPGTVLPPHDEAFTFFRLVQNWKQAYNLPNEVFVSLPHAASSDDRKPQYIRFDNPLLVDLLRRLIRKAANAENQLQVVEMRPDTSELTRIHGRPFAIEAVPQWYSIPTDNDPVNVPKDSRSINRGSDQKEARLVPQV